MQKPGRWVWSLKICEFCQERLGSKTSLMVWLWWPRLIVKIGIQDCVSANKVVVVVPLPGILVLVRWNWKISSWLTKSDAEKQQSCLYNMVGEFLSYLKPGFREQGGAWVNWGSVRQYMTERHERSNAVIGSLAQRELWVIWPSD